MYMTICAWKDKNLAVKEEKQLMHIKSIRNVLSPNPQKNNLELAANG